MSRTPAFLPRVARANPACNEFLKQGCDTTVTPLLGRSQAITWTESLSATAES